MMLFSKGHPKRIHYNNKVYLAAHFMHINKCAGSTVRNWLEENNISHGQVTKGSADHVIVNEFNPNVFYFTIVRNPYNRIASHFLQWHKNGMWNSRIKTPDDLISRLHKERFLKKQMLRKDHREYLQTKKTMQPRRYEEFDADPSIHGAGLSSAFGKPCSCWIKDISRFKVFKTENLQEVEDFFSIVYKYKDLTSLASHRDPSTVTHGLDSYESYFSRESLDIINDLYHEDFQNFGYEKV